MRGTCPVPSVSKIGLHISNKLPVGLHGSNFARVCAESCVRVYLASFVPQLVAITL